MNNSNFKLGKILDLNKWQNLQDSLSGVTQLAIITVDYKGNPITTHSNCNPFCAAVRKNPKLYKKCQKCDSRGGLEAVRLNKPYIYLCHFDMVDIAIPITVDDKYLGAVLTGQIRLAIPEAGAHLEHIVSTAQSLELLETSKELKEYYEHIPKLHCTEIMAIARMLFSLCNYIVEEAMNKNLILDMHEKLLHVNEPSNSNSQLNGYSLQNLKQIKNELANVVTNAYISSPQNNEIYSKNLLLKPVFEHIYTNKRGTLSLTEAANVCHISPSYFSRLFTKEMGENYSTYMSKLKIEWSKQLLERTDLPITQISDELGFNDPGYFIKTFKRYESITPAIYRKYFQ